MYKLIIADDERIDRLALRKMINNSFSNIKVLEDAVNGYDFLDKVDKFKPNISIVDIQMPGIDGLQAVQELTKRNIKTSVIINTAYSRFQYAKKALSLGAEDYLLKPIKKREFIDTINNCIKNIELEKEKVDQHLNLKHTIKEVSKAIETDYISAADLNNKDRTNLLNYLNILGIKYMNIVLPNELATGNQKYIVLKKILKHMDKQLNKYCLYISSTINNNIITLFLYTEKLSTGNIKTWSKEYKKIISNEITKSINIPVKIEINDINEEDMDLLLFIKEKTEEVNLDINEKYIANRFLVYKKKIFKYIKAKDYEGIIKIVSLYLSDFSSKNTTQLRDRVKLFIYQIQYYLLCKDSIVNNNMVNINAKIDTINTLSEAEEYLSYFIRHIIDNNTIHNLNIYVKNSLKYVNKHYKEDISLISVAEKVNISPYYLSRLFKQELNINFTDYVTELRILHAIEQLMHYQDFSIMELASSSGYNNHTYFCKVFKKLTGKTVNSFKENCLF